MPTSIRSTTKRADVPKLVTLSVAFLVLTAVFASFWGRRMESVPQDMEVLFVGDSLGSVAAITSEDGSTTLELDAGMPVVVLAFRSTCRWCEEVAPHWADWLAIPRPGVRIVGVTTDSLSVGRRYADEKGWGVEVVSVRAAAAGSPARKLAFLTPWVFVFDEAGRLRHTQPGHNLNSLSRVSELHDR